MTSSTEGPHHGSGVRPALCHPIVNDRSPSRPATWFAVSCNCSTYRHHASHAGEVQLLQRREPSSSSRVGSECAEKITAAPTRSSPVNRSSASRTRDARKSRNPGASYHCRTNVNLGPPPASAIAFSTRSTYVSTDMPDQWGARTTPTACSMPSRRISVMPSGMNGGECFMPKYTRNVSDPSAFSSRSSAAPCRRVISSRGNRFPIAAYRSFSSARCSGVGARPLRMSV